MKKYIAFACLLTLTLGLSACGAPKTAAPAEAPPYGGGYAESEAVSIQAAPAYEQDTISGGADYRSSVPEDAVERMIIKNASLSIVVPDPAGTLDEIVSLAESMGGFVVSSQLRQTTLSNGATVDTGSITIRVPAERFEEALDAIKRGAGEVLSENISGEDVTRQYTDLQSRLRNLEAAEAQLVQIMEEARRTEDVLQVYNQLVSVREQIEVIKGEMQYYEQSAAFSAISVDITADEANKPLQIGGWQPVGVAKDAIEALIKSLQGLTNFLIWLVLYILPMGLVIGVPLYFLGRAFRRWRRRRRHPFDGD